MTEHLLCAANATPAAPADSRALVLSSLTASLQALPALLQSDAPSAHTQAADLLQQAAAAAHSVPLGALATLLQAMVQALQLSPEVAQPADRPTSAHDALLLASKDAIAYLQALHSGGTPSQHTLFSAYRAVCKLSGKDSAHPADLWAAPWKLAPTDQLARVADHTIEPTTRALLDQQVLAVVKTADPHAAQQLRDLCLGLGQTRAHAPDSAFWQAASACFDATAHGLLEHDLYTKRLASRVLMHYANAAKLQGQSEAPLAPPETLVRDLLFYCVQAHTTCHTLGQPVPPVLQAVGHSCGLWPKATDANAVMDSHPDAAPVDNACDGAKPPSATPCMAPAAAPPAFDLSHLVFDDAEVPDEPDTPTATSALTAPEPEPEPAMDDAGHDAHVVDAGPEVPAAEAAAPSPTPASFAPSFGPSEALEVSEVWDTLEAGDASAVHTASLQAEPAQSALTDAEAETDTQNSTQTDAEAQAHAAFFGVPEISPVLPPPPATAPADAPLPATQPAASNALFSPDIPQLQPVAPLLQGNAAQPQLEPNLGFLSEADALSRQLQNSVAAWVSDSEAADADLPLLPSAAEQARTLTHDAWSAGCTEISMLTHTLQVVLERISRSSTAGQRLACLHAADEVLRLLHQFAAGFMRRPHPQVLEALNLILAQTTSASAAPDNGATGSNGAAEEAAAGPPHTAVTTQTTHFDGTASDSTAQAPAALPLPARTAAIDQLDTVRFAVFEEEVLAVWPALQTALHQWMEAPAAQAAPRQTLLRSLHTLKGSARLAGAAAWASQVHALEDLALLAQANAGPLGPASLQAPLESLRIAFVALQQEMAARHPERCLQHWGHSPVETVGRHAQALWGTHEQTQQSLSESSQTLGEMDQCLQRLRSQLKDCAAWADTLVLHGDMDLSYEWHEELHDLIRNLGDCTDDIGTVQHQLQHGLATAETALSTQAGHMRALQHTLLYARLTPLSQLHDRLLATVQLAASDTGKATQLVLEGGDQLMERSVAEQLTPALEHLLRNCVDHGMEAAAERAAQGKPAQGSITLRLETVGASQVLSLQDDGAGLQVERIRAKAIALGLLAADEAVDAVRAGELILQPGLSTATQITELSGRGIGMDAVQATVQALGGQLRIDSTPGQGCRFVITLQAPPQVEQVVALRAGSWSIAVPARSIEAVRRIPAKQMDQAVAQGMLPDDVTGPMPLYWAGAVWQQSLRSSAPPLDGQSIALVVRSDTSRWALQVDEVLGTQEVALQPATDVVVHLPGLLGTAAQPSGQVLQVYDPYAALAAHEARRLLQSAQPATDAAPETPVQRPLVLIADDSISVRRLAQHLLQASGYRVETAADGLQAWNLLEGGELPALLLVDIEMPEMDGLELLRRVRADARCKQLPVVMLTAHEAGPLSQKAIDAGAQAFLTKPYAPNELLALVRRCAVAS